MDYTFAYFVVVVFMLARRNKKTKKTTTTRVDLCLLLLYRGPWLSTTTHTKKKRCLTHPNFLAGHRQVHVLQLLNEPPFSSRSIVTLIFFSFLLWWLWNQRRRKHHHHHVGLCVSVSSSEWNVPIVATRFKRVHPPITNCFLSFSFFFLFLLFGSSRNCENKHSSSVEAVSPGAGCLSIVSILKWLWILQRNGKRARTKKKKTKINCRVAFVFPLC